MLAIVPWGPVHGNEDLQTKEGFASRGYLTSKPVQYDAIKPPLEREKGKAASPAELDPNHSHFIFESRVCAGASANPSPQLVCLSHIACVDVIAVVHGQQVERFRLEKTSHALAPNENLACFACAKLWASSSHRLKCRAVLSRLADATRCTGGRWQRGFRDGARAPRPVKRNSSHPRPYPACVLNCSRRTPSPLVPSDALVGNGFEDQRSLQPNLHTRFISFESSLRAGLFRPSVCTLIFRLFSVPLKRA